MKTKTAVVLVGIVVAAVAALSYASPYWTLHQMKVAAQESNISDMNEHVDYPALRESLKSQLRTAMNKELGSNLAVAGKSEDGATGALGATVGTLFAGAMVDGLVDALITPEAVSEIVKKGKNFTETNDRRRARDGDAPDTNLALAYKGWDKVVVTATSSEPGAEPVELHLQRASLFSWKLAGVILPLDRAALRGRSRSRR